MNKLVLGTAVAVGLVAAGLGLAGVAAAAPTTPSATSSAPASGAPVPVPLVYQPVDTDHFYGVERGSVPTASTSSLSQVPILNRLPAVDVTPFPAKDDDRAEADDAPAGDPTGDAAATDESAPASETEASPAP